MTDEEKMLPCICGGEAKVYQDTSSDYERHWDWGVYCLVEDCRWAVTGLKTKQEAIAFWNTRPSIKAELEEAFYAARISECTVFESNSVRTSGASKFLGLKYKTFDDWYKTRGRKL